MKAHELAQKLLEGENLEIVAQDNGCYLQEVSSVQLLTVDEYHQEYGGIAEELGVGKDVICIHLN